MKKYEVKGKFNNNIAQYEIQVLIYVYISIYITIYYERFLSTIQLITLKF